MGDSNSSHPGLLLSPKERKKTFFPSRLFSGVGRNGRNVAVCLSFSFLLSSPKRLSLHHLLFFLLLVSADIIQLKRRMGEKNPLRKRFNQKIYLLPKLGKIQKFWPINTGKHMFPFFVLFCLANPIRRKSPMRPFPLRFLRRLSLGGRGTEEEKFSLRFPSENKWIKCPPSSLSLPPFSHVSYSTNTKSPPPLIPLFPHTPCENADGMRNGRRGGKSQKREKGLQKEALFSL